MIVPNPESALNEEAGRLLLEQYDDYAKRARLYTSIQAKAGKSEFTSLLKERSHNEENEGTPKDDNNNVLTPIIDEKQITSTISIATNTTTVLKALSNTSTTNNINNKRPRSSQASESQQQQPEIKKVKKAMTATGQKKKSLRRL